MMATMDKPLRVLDGDGAPRRAQPDESSLQRALSVRVDATVCDRSQALLALLAELDTMPRRYMPAQRRAVRHVSGCLRCQRDLAFARSARSAVSTLRDQVLAANIEDVAGVLAAIDDLGELVEAAASGRALFKRPVVIAGVTVALIGGVTGGIVVAWHLRRRAAITI